MREAWKTKAVERMKTKPKPSPTPRTPEPATPGEIKQAIEALTLEDTERIEQSARNRIYRIGRAANRREAEELIGEAFMRILDGKRHWYKDRIGFTNCLIGVIWSIASEWAGYRERNKDLPEYASLESELTRTDEEGKIISPFDGLAAPALNPEQARIQAEVRMRACSGLRAGAHSSGSERRTRSAEQGAGGRNRSSFRRRRKS